MSKTRPTYDELEKRCRDAETMLQSILSGETDTVESDAGRLVIRVEEAEERELHVRRVLMAIRNVNQLIVQENDPKRLIERAVVNLTETMGYNSAWIGILNSEGSATKMTAGCGFRSGFEELAAQLARGEFPRCMHEALSANRTVLVERPEEDFPACPVAKDTSETSCLAHRLAAGDRIFGVLVASIPARFVQHEEQRSLFEEVAGDLGFALGRIEDAMALAEIRRRYQEIFEGSRDGFVVVDHEGGFIDANKAFCDMVGYSLDELRQLDDFYSITPERWHRWERDEIWTNRLLKQGYSDIYEKEYIRKDGTVFPVELQSYAAFGPDGNLEYLWGVTRDVSEGRAIDHALRENEEKYRALVMQSADCLVLHDLDGSILDVNSWSCNTYGYTRDELLQMKVSDLDPDYEERELSGFWERLSPRTPIMFEARQRKRDGTIFPVEVRLSLIELRGKKLVLGLCRDISERCMAEESLRLQSQVLNQIQDRVTVTDLEGNITYINDAECRTLGVPREEIIGQNVSIYGDDPVVGGTQEEIIRKTKEDGHWRGEVVNFKPDGSRVILDCRTHLVKDTQGEPVAMCGISTDVTQQREAEAALRESEQRFRAIFEHMAAASCLDEIVYDNGKAIDYRILDVNPAYERLIGISRSDVVGRLASEVYGLDKAPFLETYSKVAQTGEPAAFETFFEPIRRFLDVTVSCPAPGRFSIVSSDITERKMAETARRESERRLRTLLGNLPGMAYRCIQGPGWPMEFLSEGCKPLTGYAPEDFIAGAKLHYEEIIVPEDRDRVIREIETAVNEELPYEVEYRIVTAEGERRWVWERGRAVGTNNRRETVLEGFITDVTERKRVEDERERLLFAIEQSGEIVVVTDREGTIQYANPAFETVTGYSREETIGRNPRIIKSGEQDDEFYRHLWGTISSGRMWQGRFVNRKKDGSLYTEDATISPVLDETGDIVHYVGVKRDITKELDLEERYRQSQKLEAIGQLAGGVAHDFNNLLLVINGYSEMAVDKLGEGHPARGAIEGVMKAGERAATLVSQLLAFSRRQIMRPEDLDLNEVVSDLIKMLARIIGEDVRLDFVPGFRLGSVHADRGMIEQIVMNLCVNARDAMPEGGTLALETENVFINGEYVETHPWAKPGRYVLLSITDTGCGMDEKTLARIFEPFFTTKGVGRGTGLGLATVYGIVQQHDGMIQAYSELGKGTVFKVYLRIAERKASAVGSKVEGPVRGGTETILLAEDDEAVLTMLRELLERVGYTVVAAANGEEALAIFEKRGDEIDLAILDVVMPNMGGKEVYDRMVEMRPNFPILFASGYSENAVHTDFILDGSLTLLQKPYNPLELYRTIRAVLDS